MDGSVSKLKLISLQSSELRGREQLRNKGDRSSVADKTSTIKYLYGLEGWENRRIKQRVNPLGRRPLHLNIAFRCNPYFIVPSKQCLVSKPGHIVLFAV